MSYVLVADGKKYECHELKFKKKKGGGGRKKDTRVYFWQLQHTMDVFLTMMKRKQSVVVLFRCKIGEVREL